MTFDDDSTPVSPFPEDEMPPEDMGFDEDEAAFDDEEPLGEEAEGSSSNKTFIVAVAALIGFLVIAMALMAAYAFFVLPSKRKAQATQAAQINAQNTAIAQGLTATAVAALWTNTPLPTHAPTATPIVAATSTPQATRTPVVAQATPTPIAAINATAFALTATSIAMTSVAAASSPQPTSLAQTGFADQVGLPGLVAVAALLIVVVFLARRLRQSV